VEWLHDGQRVTAPAADSSSSVLGPIWVMWSRAAPGADDVELELRRATQGPGDRVGDLGAL